MLAARVASGARGKDPAPDLFTSGWDYAVSGKQDGTMEGHKFFKLLPPCVTVVSGKIIVFFESRVIMSGQHLAVGIHIHTSAFGLLQSCSRSVRSWPEIRMAGFLRTDIDLSNFRISNFDVLASSRRAMAFTPYSPVFSVSATRSSAVRESSNVAASAS